MDLDFLRSIPLFAGLTEGEAGRVAGAIIERTVASDAVVFGEGDPGQFVYFVRTGKIKISRYSMSGQEFIIGVWGPGSPVGLIAALDEGVYPATASALAPSTVWAIAVGTLKGLAETIPALKNSLMNQVGLRIRLFQDRVYERDLLDTRGKLASLLVTLARSTGVRTASGLQVAHGLMHRDLGAMIGVRRETIARMLGDFQRSNLVLLGRSGIVITDLSGLRALTVV